MIARSASSTFRLSRALPPALVAAACVAWVVPKAPADEELVANLSEQVGRIFSDRASAVVRVEARDRHGMLCGTGFFVDPMGTLCTVYSAVGDSEQATVVLGDEEVIADVLMSDPRSGLALLKIDRSTPFIPRGAASTLQLATPVLAIGFPNTLPASPTFGIVGGFDRQFLGKFFVTTHIRAHMPVQPGFGGAPLLNMRGEVVGVVIAGADRGATCYALPIEAAEKLMRNLARYGEPRHGWVGVTVEGSADGEVRVAELGPETPAARSGIQAGDLLLSVGSVAVKEVEDVLDASFFLTDGDPVEIRVEREGSELSFTVMAIAHPATSQPSGEKIDFPAIGAIPTFNLLEP